MVPLVSDQPQVRWATAIKLRDKLPYHWKIYSANWAKNGDDCSNSIYISFPFLSITRKLQLAFGGGRQNAR